MTASILILPDAPGIQHTANGQVHLQHFHLSMLNCHFVVFKNGAYPENLHILYCHIKSKLSLTMCWIASWDPNLNRPDITALVDWA